MEKRLKTQLEIISQIAGVNPLVSQEPLIFKLNDDCLVNIFRFLTIRDRLIAERGMFTD